MKTTRIAVRAVIAAVALAFAACDNPTNPIPPPTPPHSHNWGSWGATTLEGTEQRVCKGDSSHIQHRLTGTDRFTFTSATSTSYRVKKGTVISGAVVIPAYYRPDTSGDHLTNRGYLPVTEIGDASDSAYSYPYEGGAFSATGITAVNIPDTITSIGGYAFAVCVSLDGVTIPASVTTIGRYAFSNCISLTSVTIPSSVKSIGDYAFSGCTSLTSVTIPASVTEIGNYAFSNCISLTSITIPTSVQSIGDYAFSGCTSLTNITIPASVTAIGYSAFDDWNDEQIIRVPFNDKETADEKWGVSWRSQCDALIIGKTVAYDGTPGLAFELINNDTAYRVSEGSVTDGKVIIPASYNGKPVREIGGSPYGAFAGTSITSVKIPEGVTTIGGSAFSRCTSLTSITIPASVKSIGGYAFSGDDPRSGYYAISALTTVIFAEGSQLQSIGDSAFSWCPSLTGITIPASVTTIGNHAFSGCSSLASITVAANNPNYASQGGILYNKAKTEIISIPQGISGYVTIPEGVTSINSEMLYMLAMELEYTNYIYRPYYPSITGITVAANNPNYASQDGILYNKAKTSILFIPWGISGHVTIPEGVTSIGVEADQIGVFCNFDNHKSLTGITIPASVTTIGNYAFSARYYIGHERYDPMALTTVIFAAGSQLQTIGNRAFAHCENIANITIPASVTSVGEYAFEGWGWRSNDDPSVERQKIYVEGYAGEYEADAAWGGNWWRSNCNAQIIYSGG